MSLPVMEDDDMRTIALIPPPSDSPLDPLNWSTWKKGLLLFTICFAAFAGGCSAVPHQASFSNIAPTYHKTSTELTYSVSSGVAGLLAGPLLLTPLTRVIGRTALIFWSLIITLFMQLWSARETSENGYISFTISRLISGIFAAIPTIVASGCIVDICFLHQRGRAFAVYEMSLLFGVFAAPTISAFLVSVKPWPIIFWWTIAPLGVAIVLVALFLDETEFLPGRSHQHTATLRESYIAHRLAVLAPCPSGLIPTPTWSAVAAQYAAPFLIAMAPATLIAGFFSLIVFGFSFLVTTEQSIYLSTPVAEGGYGFRASEIAGFTLTSWIALLAAQLFASFYADRFPVWLAARTAHGRWSPEYRLAAVLLPGLLMPIGLGLTGVALHYHLHYAVLALGFFLVVVAAVLCVPLCINYVVEGFVGHANAVAAAMAVYRLALGIALSFFFEPWQEVVGVGWLFGMAAIFSLLGLVLVCLLIWQGPRLRRIVFLADRLVKTEEGEQIVSRRFQTPTTPLPCSVEEQHQVAKH